MTPELTDLLAAMAAHLAHERGWTLEEATRYVTAHAKEAREEYRAMGSPFGDSDEAFYRWLTRPRTTPAA